MLEADGMTMTAHLLPQILSAALLNATVGQPGWTETRRFAGQPFVQSTAALGSDTLEALEQALFQNPLSATNALDNTIGALTHLRMAIEKGDRADLHKRLELALADRENWLGERQRADWNRQAEKPDAPKSADLLKRFFMGNLRKDKK